MLITEKQDCGCTSCVYRAKDRYELNVQVAEAEKEKPQMITMPMEHFLKILRTH